MEAIQQGRDFVEKLIAALKHPEPETRARSALILRLRKDRRGVEPLMRVVRESEDSGLVEAALDRGTLRVRRVARQALASLEKRNE